MNERRWFNSRQPQTLVIAQFLLYFDAVFLALAALGWNNDYDFPTDGMFARLVFLAAAAANAFGAFGVANEMKRGYQVAVVASFLPIAVRFVIVVLYGSVIANATFYLLPGGILNAIFVYALIALVLHRQSRDYQQSYFA
ncbi:MAG: hypothetical protein FJW94_03860 [Actinobacteria bacterium]|nr:hypothetical protein [Actinomycetota bacterium]